MSNTPSYEQREHIEEIRKDFDLSGLRPSRHVENLERALELLSDELYNRPTHFLLELIQNASDNDYDCSEPTLTFTYEDCKLRIDCNEQGFTKANVEAICCIGHSTKAGKTGTGRYVGEKGIGFKSVFKVADKVWISSNGYTFMFDKSQTLGMMAPIWEEFPKPTVPGVTSMLLELNSSYDPMELVMNLQSLDTRMLIFLRTLREIEVHVHLPGHPSWQTRLTQTQGSIRNGSTVVLTHDSKEFTYNISRHEAKNMPREPKRPGVTRSEVVLAFPILSEDTKNLDPQQVYAFLPIRDYGFKFLLQGDFLLSVNREDILIASPWNIALRDCFVQAFVGLVKNSHQSFLQYNWPRFLPVEPLADSFFETARISIIKQLKDSFILRNSLEELVTPRRLFQVPDEFRAKEGGLPLLAFGNASNLFLSEQYDETCLEALEELGVRKMELKDFSEILKRLLATDRQEFQKQPNEWHSQFARHLLTALWDCKDRSQRDIIRKLPIVPLEKNEWVTPSEEGVFLPPESEEGLQLEGINLKLVRKDAAADESIAALFKHLGIPVINQQEMCRYVADSLSRAGPLPRSMTGIQLISQTLFLFKAGWRNPMGKDIYFTNKADQFVRGSTIYISSAAPYGASQYLPYETKNFLHDRYVETAQTMSVNVEEFKRWLEDCMHLWEIPRLLSVLPASKGLKPRMAISPEFRKIVDLEKSPSWVYLLRDNHRKYSVLYDLGELLNNKLFSRQLGERTTDVANSHMAFLASISTLQVRCVRGDIGSLKDMYLPHQTVKEDCIGNIPLLDVPDPDHPDWHFLKRFGLGVEPDLMLYLRCLARLSLTSNKVLSSQHLDKRVGRLLDQIQARYVENPVMVRQYFNDKELIRAGPVSESSRHRWLKASQCLWAGGDCFRRLPVLKNRYPGNETLFRKVLGIKDAQLTDLEWEACQLRVGDDLRHIVDIFMEIEKRLNEDDDNPQRTFSRLASNSIFPVSTVAKQDEFNCSYKSLQKVSCDVVDWFIADRPDLSRSFTGSLPLLAFSVELVARLKKTMERMKLDRHRLSRCAQSTAETEGTAVLNADLTRDWQTRVSYILRLIPSTVPIKTKWHRGRQLRQLRVFQAEKLIQNWYVTLADGQLVRGRPCKSNVVLSVEKDGALHVFLSRKYIASSVCKLDVTHSFADYCEIGDKLELINMALWESLEEIELKFRNHGIEDYDPRIDHTEPPEEAGEDVVEQEHQEMEVTSKKGSDGFLHGRETSFKRAKTIDQQHEWLEGHSTADLFDKADQEDTKSVLDRLGPHYATRGIKFDDIGIQSIFGSTDLSELGSGPAQPRANEETVKGFRSFFKMYGLRPKSLPNSRSTLFMGTEDPDLQYRGEHFFSSTLSRFPGISYLPETHWTSTLRVRDGLSRFGGSSATHAAFTLPDPTGAVTKAVLIEFPDLVSLWSTSPPTWHFEVKTTSGGLDTAFYLTNPQLDRARAFSTMNLNNMEPIPRNITVLVRVYTVDERGLLDATLYRDPWEMFLTGGIAIKADSLYQCCVKERQEDFSAATHADSRSHKDNPPANM